MDGSTRPDRISGEFVDLQFVEIIRK